MPKPDRSARGRKYTRGPHLIDRGGWWYAYLSPAHPREALGTQDQASAARILGELLDGRRPRGVDQPAQELSLPLIAQRYLSAPHGWTPRTARACMERALAWVRWCESRGVTLASQVTVLVRDEWITARMADGAPLPVDPRAPKPTGRRRRTRPVVAVKRATVARDVAVIRKMLAWGAHPDRAYCSPCAAFAGFKPPKEPRRLPAPEIPSPAEVTRCVSALEDAGDHGGALYLAAILATGLRIDEMRHVEARHVSATGVQLGPVDGDKPGEEWTSKGYRARFLPMSPAAVEVFRAFLRWRDGDGDETTARAALSDHWAAAVCDRAGALASVPKFRSHDLRRTFATECRRAGIDLLSIQRWLGHRDSQTTERYLGVYRSDAGLVAPTPAALAAFSATLGQVIPLRRTGTEHGAGIATVANVPTAKTRRTRKK